MRTYGRSSVHEFLGDFICYRNLVPLDQRLPSFDAIREELGLCEGPIPRKSAPAYAHVIVQLLREARALESPKTPIERLIYVGDTRLNDGTAFLNLCRAGGWSGLAFIADETKEPTHVELVESDRGTLFLANRWSLLSYFDRFCRKQGFPFDGRTAVVVDLDKTVLGARGRNDHVIDRVRIEAARRAIGALFGERFDQQAFEKAYALLNTSEFHRFTSDNQDHLAYLCLILQSGLCELDRLTSEIRSGELTRFEEFIERVDKRSAELPNHLRQIHEQVYHAVCKGDPTPFKAFRRAEYEETVMKMGTMNDDAPVSALLSGEILITQEVRKTALAWREEGALIFGLSDKPDEASIPTPEMAALGYLPIHRIETHAVGG
jgi:hypothetical protein